LIDNNYLDVVDPEDGLNLSEVSVLMQLFLFFKSYKIFNHVKFYSKYYRYLSLYARPTLRNQKKELRYNIGNEILDKLLLNIYTKYLQQYHTRYFSDSGKYVYE